MKINLIYPLCGMFTGVASGTLMENGFIAEGLLNMAAFILATGVALRVDEHLRHLISQRP